MREIHEFEEEFCLIFRFTLNDSCQISRGSFQLSVTHILPTVLPCGTYSDVTGESVDITRKRSICVCVCVCVRVCVCARVCA